jgi:hypothetical protein
MWYLSEANKMTDGIRVLILIISGKRMGLGGDQETEGGEKMPAMKEKRTQKRK